MSEKTLLGQILTDNSIYSSLVITENDFEEIKNKQILYLISYLILKDKLIRESWG